MMTRTDALLLLAAAGVAVVGVIYWRRSSPTADGRPGASSQPAFLSGQRMCRGKDGVDRPCGGTSGYGESATVPIKLAAILGSNPAGGCPTDGTIGCLVTS